MSTEITYEQIFHQTSNGAVVTDQDGIIVFINRQAEKIHDLDARKDVGRFISEILPLTGPQVLECIRTGQPILGHHIIGNKVDLTLNITPLVRNQKIKGAICNFQEMRLFEKAAQKLESYKRINKQLEAIFNSSSDGIWVLDRTGQVLAINKAAEKVEGIRALDVVGKNIRELVEDGSVDRAVTPEVLATQKQVTIVSYKTRANKTLLVTGTPAFDENGDIYLVVVNERDMTELTALKNQLEDSQMVTEKIMDELAELTMQDLREHDIVAESKEMNKVLEIALRLSRIEASNILILGESGTGKGLLAKFIHKASRSGKKPFIQINCAALPENLLEAELFGYEKGAFTGARDQGKAGLIELAHEGTLFLDEIGDMPLSLQAKLLKYLDDYEVMRLGGTKSIQVNCSVIAATNRDIQARVRKRQFRQDLFYRLNVFTLEIPPLRERPEDIFDLVHYYLNRYNKKFGVQKKIHSNAIAMLQAYPFPGNIRELKNIVKKAVAISENPVLDDFIKNSIHPETGGGYVPVDYRRAGGGSSSLASGLLALEKQILKDAMTRCRSTSEVAKDLGISQPTAFRKMRKHGLSF